MKYGIGLDIGIASVGSCVMELDTNNEPYKILKLCSRVFETAEGEKGKTPASERRYNRSIRRITRRRRHRKERIRAFICSYLGVNNEEINAIYEQVGLSDIYAVRYEALDRLLSKEELIRLLIHYSQRRGFKSNRKTDASDESKSEEGALLGAASENKALMKNKGYRTIGEMLYRDEKFLKNKRNKGGEYSNTFLRSDFEEEIRLVFKKQRSLSNPYISEEFEEKYLGILLSQRSFDEGPGSGKNSIYSGNQIEKMLRPCTLEPDEIRAPKASFSFEYFSLLSKINSVRIQSRSGKRVLTAHERMTIRELAFKQKELNFGSLRKALSLSENELFNISYASADSIKKKNNDKPFAARNEVEKKTKFTFLKAYHIFKKAFGDPFDMWDNAKKNDLAYALTVNKTDSSIKAYLSEKGFSDDEIKAALTIPSFTKFGNLSNRAMDKMIPYLEQGYLYNEAAEKAGYNFKADDKCAGIYLPANAKDAPELDDIVNSVVRRAVSQTIKVVNAIIREMGCSPTYVNIELARELSKSYDERIKSDIENKKNQARNDAVMERLRTEFRLIDPKGQDLIKLRLWEEQQGICLYSGKPIPVERLFESGFCEIDHIIPYSISFDDRTNNKALVLTKENREKGNRLPLQYLSGKAADDFRIRIQTSSLRYMKKKNLLKESITDDDYSSFKQRNLQDTQYICRFMKNYIEKYLLFDGKTRVIAVNGAATSYIRKRWGIKKIREDGDTHHAIDACVIACTTQGMIQKISIYSKYKETEYMDENGEIYDIDRKTGELINRFPMPYPTFRKELEMLTSNDPQRILSEQFFPNYDGSEQLNPIFVSRMPKRKVTGAAHKATLRKPVKENGQNYVVQKISLTSLKLDNDGEIANYYMPQSDRLLYNALKARLTDFNGDAKKAFAEPFYKPKSDGSRGPFVRKVKTIEKSSLTVPLANNTAAADNDSMVRVDVFYVNGEGYYLVPIYVADTVKKELPSRAITRDRPYNEWNIMDDKDFVFSLYPNDLIKVTSKKKMKFSLVRKESTLDKEYLTQSEFLYYRCTGISTASIKVINHDNTYKIDNMGVKTLLNLEKYEVDVLGNIHKVNKEKRMGF